MMCPVLVLIGVMASVQAAQADHHLVKRALQAVGCIPASLKEGEKTRNSTVYDVVCRGARAKHFKLICTPRQCFVEDHGHDRGD
jgi:hypothetical protein